MPHLAQLLVRMLLVSAVVTLVAAEQPQEPHYTVDSIVPEDDAMHASVPKHTAHRTQAPTITKDSPDGAMSAKVMLLLKKMIQKKQQAQEAHAQVAKKHTVAKRPTVHKRVVHHKAAKMLLQGMQHKAAAKQHKIAPKKAPKKVAPKPKKIHIKHVKNGQDILKNMVLATENIAHKREVEIARAKKEVADKKKAAKAAVKKVDPMEAALSEAAKIMDAKEAKEVQRKLEMAKSLKTAQAADSYDDEDLDDEDDLPPRPTAASTILESAEPATLSSKGQALLGRLMADHNMQAKKKATARLEAKKQAEAKKLAEHKAAKAKAAKKAAALDATKHAKKDTATELLKALGVHAVMLPHRKHTQHKAAPRVEAKEIASEAPKAKVSLVDRAIMDAMKVDLHSLSSKKATKKQHLSKSKSKPSHEEDRLSEEEIFSREVTAHVHRESNTKIKRRREEAQLRRRSAEKSEKQAAASEQEAELTEQKRHTKAAKASSEDATAAAIAAKLFKQLSSKKINVEDLQAAVKKHVAKHLNTDKAQPKLVEVAPKSPIHHINYAKPSVPVATVVHKPQSGVGMGITGPRADKVEPVKPHVTGEATEILADLKAAA